jgi:hypothetical protein
MCAYIYNVDIDDHDVNCVIIVVKKFKKMLTV